METSRFGDWLLDQMEGHNLTKADVAQIAGAPRQHVTPWLQGTRKPTPAQVQRLAHHLNSTPDHLYHLLGKIPPDIEHGLRNATPDVFRAVRYYL